MRSQTHRKSIAVAILTAATSATVAAPSSPHIRIDQFGYKPLAKKIAILRAPVQGFDAPLAFTPGPLIQVRRVSDNQSVFSAAATSWNAGATHTQSGDKVWRFDFTTVATPGSYYIHDPTNTVSSEPFDIRDDVYDLTLRHAMRMYYYQRCGTPKSATFVPSQWSDPACHLGPQQDLDCRSVSNPVAATSRNLSGGWHDAGDYNKYINYADSAVHSLLFAYQDVPWYWPDDTGIPESGNSIPDLLDELKWELDWMLRMQNPDGSVLHKMAVTDFSAASPPSTDSGPRRYAPATASATISACAAYAHAAIVYNSLPQTQPYAAALQAAAINAWNWLNANPAAIPSNYNNAGFVNAPAEESAYDQATARICAAAYLFRLTGQSTYRTFVDSNYTSIHLFVWSYASVWEQEYNDALLLYAASPGATASVASQIRQRYTASVIGNDHLVQIQNLADPYGAFLEDGNYTWGSNRTKCLQGQMYMSMLRNCIGGANSVALRDASEAFVHYIHGLNPLGLTFLTNMGPYGAESSLNEMYHGWFGDGTVWDSAATSLYGPPPGYLPGGPNPSYSPDGAYTGPPIVPPQSQPIQKSYKDWNTSWPQNSWEITECHIPQQAAYVRLLANVAAGRALCSGDITRDGHTNGLDIDAFVRCLLGNGANCPCADLNNSGTTTATDIPFFISQLLTAPVCQ